MTSDTSATLAIGCAAGFGGDRTDAALPIVETLIARGGRGVLIFEMLAERTLALAQIERLRNPELGFAPLMEAMVRPILEQCLEHGIPIVSNFGAANPRAAARRIRQMAANLGAGNLRIAVVEGDDLSDPRGRELLRQYLAPADAAREMVSANVYLGASAIAEALRRGAQVVVTGRVADPSLKPSAPSSTTIEQGQLESSNTGPAETAVRLISVMRQFEMLQKAVSLGSEMNRRAIEEVAKV